MSDIVIRAAAPSDAPRLLEIYAPYVRETAITFEYTVPSLDEFRGRIEKTLRRWPYLAAVADGRVIGYAYAAAFKERAAYAWSAELSIYTARDAHGRGAGRALYEALERCLSEQGVHNVNACIATPQTDDEYLTHDSIHFHAHMGYRVVGEFSRCACKFGRWYNMTWMEKHLLPHEPNPAPVKPFDEVRAIVRAKYGIEC